MADTANNVTSPGWPFCIKLDLKRPGIPWTALGPSGRIGDFACLDQALQAINDAAPFDEIYELAGELYGTNCRWTEFNGQERPRLKGAVAFLGLRQVEPKGGAE